MLDLGWSMKRMFVKYDRVEKGVFRPVDLFTRKLSENRSTISVVETSVLTFELS